MLKLLGIMDKRQVVMYNLWVDMCNKKSLPADCMPFFIDRKLFYPYCNSLVKVDILFITTFNLSKTTCKLYLTNCLLPIATYYSSITTYKLYTKTCFSSTTAYNLRTTTFKLYSKACLLPKTTYFSSITTCKLYTTTCF